MFSDFIKHYNNIRWILRDVFLYGCFSREALGDKTSLSSRKISYEMRRIQQYLEKDLIKVDKDGRNKLLNLSYDSLSNPSNFLVNTYYNKSFTKIDLVLYFYILLILNSKKKALSLSDIEDILVKETSFNPDSISSKTIERKLKEMESELGLLKMSKTGRVKNYEVYDDILKNLSNKELEHLFYIVNLYKNIAFPVVAGHYFEETLKNYIKFERDIEIDFKEAFQYKNLHFHPVVEEEILWELVTAINEKKSINYDSISRRRNTQKQGNLIPYKIRYDVKYGRFYIVAFTKGKKCVNARLDRVYNLKTVREEVEDTNLDVLYDKCMGNSWSAVHLNGDSSCEKVEFSVVIDKKEELYIVEKIKSELKNYTVDIREGVYEFTTLVNDPYEMCPWIREYSSYIVIKSPIQLKRKIKKDWKEMLKLYGVIS